jgi:uncharacterized integral membrane protein
MIKRAGLIVLIVILFVAMFTFTALNTGEIELDLGFFQRTWPISMTLAGTFLIGTLFGMLCMTVFVFRLINERRVLRRSNTRRSVPVAGGSRLGHRALW